MALLRDRTVKKLQGSPDADLREVLDVVDFLTWRTTGQDEPLLSVSGVLSGEGLPADEVERELYRDEESPNE